MGSSRSGAPRERNLRMLAKIRPTKDGADVKAWEKTLKEIKRGYAKGPLPVSAYNLDGCAWQ